jgi:hypothetical protein
MIKPNMKVYHAINPTFGMMIHPEFNDKNYVLVAEVNEETLDNAFTMTNHIDRDWTSKVREGFVVHKKDSRSTSVSDVIVKDGVAYRCENMGWKEINPIVDNLLARFKALDFNNPDLDVTDITEEVMSIAEKNEKLFLEILQEGKRWRLIDVQEDGWDWIDQKTGEPLS